MGKTSEPLIIMNALRQGDALSSILFNFAFEEIIRNLPTGQKWKWYICLLYTDDLVLFENTRLMQVNKWGSQWIKKKPNTCFFLRKQKVKWTRRTCKFVCLSFQQVDYLRYLFVNMNNANLMHEEIKLRIKSAIKAYFVIVSLFKSKLQSINTKVKKYSTYLKSIATYDCNT